MDDRIDKQGKKVTLLGFFTNILLAIVKIITGFLGGSGALLADGIHSFADMLIDLAVLISLKLTRKPPDDCHNFGHEKYQTLIAALIALILGVVAVEMIITGIKSVIEIIRGIIPDSPSVYVLIVAAVCIVVKEILYRLTVIVGRKLNNSAIIANAWHHRTDAFASLGVMIGIAGAILLGGKWTALDSVAMVLVGLLIIRVAYKIFKPAIGELLERSLNQEEIDEIDGIIRSFDGVVDYHKLKTRRLGSKIAIEVHLELKRELNLIDAHALTLEIERQIRGKLGAETLIATHIEPHSGNTNKQKIGETDSCSNVDKTSKCH
jgi:cation diffusion facilitator family transporter